MDILISSINLTLFIPTALALLLTPGPVVMYITTRSVDQGCSIYIGLGITAALAGGSRK